MIIVFESKRIPSSTLRSWPFLVTVSLLTPREMIFCSYGPFAASMYSRRLASETFAKRNEFHKSSRYAKLRTKKKEQELSLYSQIPKFFPINPIHPSQRIQFPIRSLIPS